MSLVVLPLRGSPAEAELGEFMLPIILSQVVPALWAWDRGLSLQEACSGQGVGIYLKQTEQSRPCLCFVCGVHYTPSRALVQSWVR